jgi:hypothetical protein
MQQGEKMERFGSFNLNQAKLPHCTFLSLPFETLLAPTNGVISCTSRAVMADDFVEDLICMR